MQSITPNLEFILGWLKSPYAFGRSESVIPLESGSQFKEDGMDTGFSGVTIRLGSPGMTDGE